MECPNCGDKPLPCIQKEYNGRVYCGTTCIREFITKEKAHEDAIDALLQEVTHETKGGV
jgi:uncharacterized Zn finger protein (UPF0148 family)